MDLTTLSDTDLHDLSAQIAAEWDRRRAATVTDQAVTEVITGLQDEGKLPKPDALTDPKSLPEDTSDIPEWANPRTDHSAMYRQGDIVTHKQRVWMSNHPGLNHWEPGSVGVDGRIWLDITPPPIDEETGEEQTIAWDVGQAVEVGDLRTHNGKTWRCKTAHTTHEGWPPSAATHAVWEPVTP